VNWTGRLFLLCLVAIMAGCATGISQHARSQVTYHGPFSALQADIYGFRGEVVMLGGKVIETQSAQLASEITVLQLPLDGRGRPQDGDHTEGRYLVRSGQFLDPALYEKGTLVTVVGRLTGGESRFIGSFAYVHPVVEILEIKSWHGWQDTAPHIHFGIGVGTSF
jgi:outer membrane lipoprotein